MQKLSHGLKRVFSKFWEARRQWMLPLVLIVLVIIQTQVFNSWLGIQALPSRQRFLSSLAIGLFFFGPAMALARRARYIWLTVWSILLELLFVAQYIYFLSFNTFIRGSSIRYVSYVGSVGGSIAVQLKPALLFFVTMPVVVLLWYLLVDRHKREPKYRIRTRVIALVLILLVAIATFAAMLSIEQKKHGGLQELLNVPYDNSTMVTKVGVVTYSLLDTYRYFTVSRGITEAEKQYVQQWQKDRPKPAAPSSSFGVAKGKNVILVQMESFDSFAIGRRIDGQEITPNLNKLIQSSKYYSNYQDQVSTGRTADGEFETQNSLLPTMDRVAFFEYATHDYHALPEILDEQGYTTAVFHGDVPTFWNRNVAYPYIGWKNFFTLKDFIVHRAVGWGLSDEDLIRQSVPKLAQLKQPFYSNIITVSSHTPFHLDDDLKPLKIKDLHGITAYQMDYIQTLAYTDRQLGVLIDELKKNGLYNNSILALFGDHRAFIANKTDSGFAQFVGAGTSFGDISFFHDGEHIPLIVHVPGANITGTDATPASHLDYAPTILSLLGIEPPSTMLGQDLLRQHEPVTIRRNTAGGIQYIETNNIFYVNTTDSTFDHGTCYQASDRKQIDLASCKAAYDEQSGLAKVSDIVVRGDALNLLK